MGSLKEGWLSVELKAAKEEVGGWTDGLKESYESLMAQSTKASAEDHTASPSDDRPEQIGEQPEHRT